MGNFKTDLAKGQAAEKIVANIFINKGYNVEFNNSNTLLELKK